MLVFYTSNEIFRAKTPWKELFSEWNFMNFLSLSLSLRPLLCPTQKWICHNRVFGKERPSVISDPIKTIYFN